MPPWSNESLQCELHGPNIRAMRNTPVKAPRSLISEHSEKTYPNNPQTFTDAAVNQHRGVRNSSSAAFLGCSTKLCGALLRKSVYCHRGCFAETKAIQTAGSISSDRP